MGTDAGSSKHSSIAGNDLEELRAAVDRGEVLAISVDTNIFERHNWGFDRGLLKRLRQFASSPTHVVLSDVVAREVCRRMACAAAEGEAALRKAVRNAAGTWGVDEKLRNDLLGAFFNAGSAEQVAKRRFDDFCENVRAFIAGAELNCNLSEVVDRYFDGRPPFSNGKKSEFPDAIALVSLENWAKRKGTKMIVVSDDNDWRHFCDQSECLVRVDDLAGALSAFHVETARYDLDELLRGEDRLNIRYRMKYEVERSLGLVDFDVEATSQFAVEAQVESAKLSLARINSFGGDQYFTIIESSDNEVTAQLSLLVDAKVVIIASFKKWDGIDREFVKMGDSAFTQAQLIEVEAVITFDKGPDGGIESVRDVELISTGSHIFMEDIEPDWGEIEG